VYLPINNALSPVGHVHGFIEELGQGVQHVASKCSDLIAFIQGANDRREVTGEGFTFLNIPRSYYGVLMETNLQLKKDGKTAMLSAEDATKVFDACVAAKVCNDTGAVDLELSKEQIVDMLKGEALVTEDVIDVIVFSR
jgi:hypothetical protein